MSDTSEGTSEATTRPEGAEPSATTDQTSAGQASTGPPDEAGEAGDSTPRPKRRRGSRGGRNRGRTRPPGERADAPVADAERPAPEASDGPDGARKPQIGDRMPAPKVGDTRPPTTAGAPAREGQGGSGRRRRRRGRGGGSGKGSGSSGQGSKQRERPSPIEAATTHADGPIELDEETLERRRGRERKGRPVGRYLMCVHVEEQATQIAVLEGRALVEHYVSRPADDATQIVGNIYLGRVENVLPGMEAAFVDIATPKNAVLYRGDVRYDPEGLDENAVKGEQPRIEDVLRNRQTIVCQVTKNPIAHKGARLTQEVSIPGRFVVLVPNSATYGISKRLGDDERKRLRRILDAIKPAEHGVIVRTAAEHVTEEELERDVQRLLGQWEQIEQLAARTTKPALLYREPDLAVRFIREEFSRDYRGIVIDDAALHSEVKSYVESVAPALADRVELYEDAESLPMFERHHVTEQLLKALDRKVWLPSGGSLIIESTEALTVIDVNTGKNVGKSSLEETVLHNNLEAADEIARQLRLRDIGGIIVIDFVDMEVAANRQKVLKAFKEALSHDKTRTQVFPISELGLVEMTRKRIGEGLLESLSTRCEDCNGRGLRLDPALLD